MIMVAGFHNYKSQSEMASQKNVSLSLSAKALTISPQDIGSVFERIACFGT